jgi:SOS-response transcriptional repressor LexA
MIPDIKPGYIVFIDSWAEVQNGNVIAAEMNGLTCIKIFKKGTNGLFLVSANRNYQAKEVTSRDDFRVLGIVRAHLAIHR